MKKLLLTFSGIALSLAAVFSLPTTPVLADTLAQDFEFMSTGSVNGQEGWSVTGPYDQSVVGAPVISGTKSFRLSNAVTSGSFGDQTFSMSLVNEAGEIDATNGGMSGGTRQNHFEAQFDFASTQSTEQPGLFVSVSPDRGDGSRMSYLGFQDSPGGIDVIFYDVTSTSSPAVFTPTTVATGLSRTAVHTAKIVIDYVDGPSNDVVVVLIDGVVVNTGTSWENYYRYDAEASAEQTPRTTDSLLFRVGGTAAPTTLGNGFLFDNITVSSGPAELSGTLAAEDFGVVDYDTGLGQLAGYTAGFGVADSTLTGATSVEVKLYSAGNVLLQTNTAILSKFNTDITGTQFSSPFDVSGTFDYVADGYWTNVRQTEYGQSVPATKVVATVTLANGKVVTATNTNLVGNPEDIYPEVVLTVPANKTECMNGGWKTFTLKTFKNQGQCVSYVQANPKAGKTQ